MDPDVASLDHRLKFRRAFHHLKQIKKAETEWLQGDTHSVRSEQNPQTRDMTFFATVTQQPPAEPVNVCIADCLHNLRSCLDLLAFELARAFTQPLTEEVAEHSEFPIFGDVNKRGVSGQGPSLFRDNSHAKIQAWDPSAKTVVEGLQPYQRGDGFRADPLWVVRELDRISKHRLLHTIGAGSKGLTIDQRRSNASFGPGVVESFGGAVDTDTPIGRFPNVRAADPSRPMHLEISPALCIAFAAGTPCVSEESVYGKLSNLYFYIGSEVFPALERFL